MQTLRQQLQQQIHDWQLSHKDRLQDFIDYFFDPRLFSENFETLEFYFVEINQNLEKLQQLPDTSTDALEFLCQRIAQQCEALETALIQTRSSKNVFEEKKTTTRRDTFLQQVTKLPPRERLNKYYEGVNKLTLRLTQLKAELSITTDPAVQEQLQQRIQQTREHRQRGRDAIDTLERWLMSQEENQ